MGRDYVYRMYKRWRSFLEVAGLNIKAGTYQIQNLHLRPETVKADPEPGGSPSTFGKNYYALNPDKVNSVIWRNPLKHYSRRNIP